MFIPYMILRNTGRALGGLVAMRTGRMEPKPPPLGRVLLAPGALSVAMLLDFQSVYKAETHVSTVYAMLLLSIIIIALLLVVGCC